MTVLFYKLKGAYKSSELSDTIFNKMGPQMAEIWTLKAIKT